MSARHRSLGSFSATSASRVADSNRMGSTPLPGGESAACPTRSPGQPAQAVDDGERFPPRPCRLEGFQSEMEVISSHSGGMIASFAAASTIFIASSIGARSRRRRRGCARPHRTTRTAPRRRPRPGSGTLIFVSDPFTSLKRIASSSPAMLFSVSDEPQTRPMTAPPRLAKMRASARAASAGRPMGRIANVGSP